MLRSTVMYATLLLCVVALSAAGRVPTEGLEAFYPFNGNAFDESGNGNYGEPVGVVLSEDRHGNDSSAYSFAHDSERVVLPSACRLTGPHTVSLWMSPETWSHASYPAAFGGHGLAVHTAKGGIALIRHGDSLVYDIYDADNRAWLFFPLTACPTTSWTHVALSWDGTQGPGAMKVYVNGTLHDSAEAASISAPLDWTTRPFIIGNSSRGDGFRGAIDDFALWSRALTATEVEEVYEDGLNVPTVDIDIDGRVVAAALTDPQPLEGAIVRLVDGGMRAVTSTDGLFALWHQGTHVFGSSARERTFSAELTGSTIRLCSPVDGTPLSVQLFDLGGRVLLSETKENAAKGLHSFALPRGADAAVSGCCILRVTLGDRTFVHRVHALSGRHSTGRIDLHSSGGNNDTHRVVGASQGIEPGVVDTLLVMCRGYETKRIALASYTESLGDITLEPLTDAALASLAVSVGALTPSFSPATLSYTVAAADTTSSITVTPAASSPAAAITVNGQSVSSGSASSPIALSLGDNTITVAVTAGDGTTTEEYVITVQVSVVVPAAPSGCDASASSYSSVGLSWTDNASNETGFKIYRSLSQSSGYTQVGTVGENVTTWSDNNLSASTTYHYRVYSYNTAGNSSDYCGCSATTSAAPTYALTTTVSPSGAGSVTRSPNQSSYTQGTTVSLTANANSGFRFQEWSGSASGTSNPIDVVMNAQKSVTATFVKVPVLSGPSAVGGDFDLQATYAWSGLSNGSEYYQFQVSSTSPTSGYTQLHQSPSGTRTSPYNCSVTWESSDASGTYYFRVRVNTLDGLSPWSNVVTVVYTKPAIEETTLRSTDDNLIMYSSSDGSVANTVYQNAYLGVGQNFDVWTYSISWLDARSLIRFSLPSAVMGSEIIEAELRLYVNALPADRNTTYRCGAVAQQWNTTTVTYNNSPADAIYTDHRADFNPPYSAAVPVTIDITGIVQSWADGTFHNYGLLLWDTNSVYPSSTTYRATQFYEESNGSSAPALYIRYQP
ncbi:MAG: DNRLRE domain-containing protein [Chitinivibrionales bacterium]|nr:DNRLRE domain-containing protein [Chitinivibrionales bacterium]